LASHTFKIGTQLVFEAVHSDEMRVTRPEVDEMLRRADEARTKLRRATLELMACGQQIMSKRESSAKPNDRGPR